MQTAGFELNHQLLPVFLGLLLVTTVAWLYLSGRLYRELRKKHPVLYEKLGRPRLVMNRYFSTNFRVVSFIFRNKNETGGDEAVLRLTQGLKSLIGIYLFCLAGSIILLLGGR